MIGSFFHLSIEWLFREFWLIFVGNRGISCQVYEVARLWRRREKGGFFVRTMWCGWRLQCVIFGSTKKVRQQIIAFLLRFLDLVCVRFSFVLTAFVAFRYEVDTSAKLEELQMHINRYVPVEIHGEVRGWNPFSSSSFNNIIIIALSLITSDKMWIIFFFSCPDQFFFFFFFWYFAYPVCKELQHGISHVEVACSWVTSQCSDVI